MADPPASDEARSSVEPGPKPGADQGGLNGASHIKKLRSSSSVLDLEAGVQVGLRLLADLKPHLSAAQGHPQIPQWLKWTKELEKKAVPARTVVGVIGVTGAGKSSLINAILDEERLVPTSGIRACTATATEISYNHSNDPSQLYRAEVEFISAEDWSRQLKVLLGDLIDGNGKISPDCNNPDTDAGLAYSKIKAVYPHMTKDKIVKGASDPSAMVQEPSVSAVLGSVALLRAASSPDLYQDLQQYVDSKEKTSSKMEYWPLIKAVRIYCKAAALSTGIVLVDLPGLGDSNSARSAIANDYMKQCSGLWIAAETPRAIDSQLAKNLLGDGFKRQLKYDGAFSAITFVCTKTDGILVDEVKKDLRIEDQVADYSSQIDDLRQKRVELNLQIEDLNNQKNGFQKQLDDLEESYDRWEELKDQLDDGEPVYRPSEISRKRKRKNSLSRRRKARGSAQNLSDTDDMDIYDDSSDGEDSQATLDQKVPLTKDEIKDKLASLKAQKKAAQLSKKTITKEIARAQRELIAVTADQAFMESEKLALCIRTRSKHLKQAFKRDFASGIKELDQDLAIEEDEANFDPEKQIQNYECFERDLPVFCVSARVYQKLAGRLEKEIVHTEGFTSLDDTEIPQLQEHARKLTEDGRKKTSKAFLDELILFLNSMRLWSAGNTRAAVSQIDKRYDEEALRVCFGRLDAAFRRAVTNCLAWVRRDLQEQLYNAFDGLIPVASASAVETAIGWGQPRAQNGMVWASYKATCRRDGYWTGKFGGKDFNAELFEPIDQRLAARWERAFQDRIPGKLKAFIKVCKVVMDKFHDDVKDKVPRAAANPAGLNMLAQQLRAHQMMLRTVHNVVVSKITETQRVASREFTPVIQEAMQPAYNACARERGPGTFGRMKATMESHVDTTRHTMFRAACDEVKQQLDRMCTNAEKWMNTFMRRDLLMKLQRDYLNTIVGGPAQVAAAVPMAERMMHTKIQPILEDADSRFAQSCYAARGAAATAALGSEKDGEDMMQM